jgi:hypothetical protein
MPPLTAATAAVAIATVLPPLPQGCCHKRTAAMLPAVLLVAAAALPPPLLPPPSCRRTAAVIREVNDETSNMDVEME